MDASGNRRDVYFARLVRVCRMAAQGVEPPEEFRLIPAVQAVRDLWQSCNRQALYIRDERREQRDRIALMVLPAIFQSSSVRRDWGVDTVLSDTHIVARAYQIADAMLEASESQVPTFVQEGPKP